MFTCKRLLQQLVLGSLRKKCLKSYNINGYHLSKLKNLTTFSFRKKTESISFTDLQKNENDCDIFGTLSNKIEHNDKLDSLPPEPDDKIEYEKSEQKRRLYITEYHKIIQDFISQNKLSEAIDVLETRMLKDEKVRPDYYAFNLLISSCGRVGYVQKAFSLFNQMKKIGVKTTPATYTSLFNACSNSPYKDDALKRAKKLHNLMTLKCIEPNIFNYHAMIKVDEMVTKQYKLKDETFNFLLQACISDKKAGFRHCLLVWRKMISKHVRPSLYSYNLLLKCTRECGIGDEFETRKIIGQIVNDPHLLNQEKSYDEVNKQHLDYRNSSHHYTINNNNNEILIIDNRPNLLDRKPYFGNIVSINDIKNPADRLMLLGGCSGFLKNMKFNKVKPDIKIFTQLVEAIPSTLTAEQNLLLEISKSDIQLDIDFCNILIKKRSLRCDYEEAKNVLSLISSEDLSVDIVTFGVLALGCKNKFQAKDLIKSMVDHGFRVNAEILGTMLGQACYHYNFGYVIYTMNMIKHEEIKPNNIFMERLKSFDENIKSLMKKRENKDEKSLDFVHSYYFKEGYRKFQNFYKKWISEVNVEENLLPWDQFRKQK
ncbi:pentatricopeptide repeat-containing protein 1, mitochondrial isoform X2 [Daktulosphaira vitifoliae]|uniref:pentatricopeptide repeat-containing protein 1, mitochondrial isoform X2 n=1 Tax=Daktulosphaira vitifoliae TaxID=58002 RepID=UPI0021A9D841|nr:pentatricopeptide repeat-containing protein 1, mitochondrial isoform X2 [Daktulosphaira vitifoliae]